MSFQKDIYKRPAILFLYARFLQDPLLTAALAVPLLFFALFFAGVSAAYGGSAAPFNPLPMFEIDASAAAGSKNTPPASVSSSATAAGDVAAMHAGQDSPPSFAVFEKLNILLALDASGEKLLRFDMSGKFLGAVKLPFKQAAVDFVWFPDTKAAFFAFEESDNIGFFEAGLAAGNEAAQHKIYNVPAISGEKTIKDFVVSRLWPSLTFGTAENCILLNAAMGADTDRAFVYKNGSLKRAAWLQKEFTGGAAFQGRAAAAAVYVRDGAAVMASYDLSSGDYDWVPLLKELSPPAGAKKAVKGLKMAGTDANGNAYVEVLFGGGASGSKDECFVYKFNRNGRFMGRARVPESPEMRASRYIYIDASGAIYYMKAGANPKKTAFYKFMIDEMN